MTPETPPPHPYILQVGRDPAGPPPNVGTSLIGMIGESDREGKVRLYFSVSLDHYAEFDAEGALDYTPISAGQSPIEGLEATRVRLVPDSRVDYTFTRNRDSHEADQFVLAARVVHAQHPAPTINVSFAPHCVGRTILTQ